MAYGPGALRALNATTRGDLTFEDAATDFERFDTLPPELRFRIAVNNTKIAAGSLVPHVAWCRSRGLGVARTIAKVNELEANELAVFAGEYHGRYKAVLPHVAAKATIQRYGAPGATKHAPKRAGKPIFHKISRPRRSRK